MSAPSTSGLSVELLLRVIDVKCGCFTLLYTVLLALTMLGATPGMYILSDTMEVGIMYYLRYNFWSCHGLVHPGIVFSMSERTLSDSKSTVEDEKKKPLVARPKTLVSMRRDSSDFSSNQFWPPSLDCFKWDNEAHHLQTFLKITITVMAIRFNSCNNFRAILTMLY